MGRIVTELDGAGRSVTVSNWGVAQSSRHHGVHGDGKCGVHGRVVSMLMDKCRVQFREVSMPVLCP
jgi:ribosomal protein S14